MPILAIMRLRCILQLVVFNCCPFIRTPRRLVHAAIQGITLSTTTLICRSTWHECCIFMSILATVRLYRILQLDFFDFCPCTRTCIRLIDAGIQDILLSCQTLTFHSTRNQQPARQLQSNFSCTQCRTSYCRYS
jgi:hypothetical protein